MNQLNKNTDEKNPQVCYASFKAQWGLDETASDQSFGPVLYWAFQLYKKKKL